MWLEDFTPEIESSEWWWNSAESIKEVSEKFKEASKKSQAKVQKTQKDEKKAKKYDLWPSVGIAAPQVGILRQMCVVYIVDGDDEVLADLRMINPKIIKHSNEMTYIEDGEGCLSIKKEHEGYVPRYHEVIVEYTDINNKVKQYHAKGFVAIAIQHELDHLEGILFMTK